MSTAPAEYDWGGLTWDQLIGCPDTPYCDPSTEPCCDGCASGLGPCHGPGYTPTCLAHDPAYAKDTP